MQDLVTAIALVFVIEGVLYALFPAQMRSFMSTVMEMSDSLLRRSGLVAAVIGVTIVWLVRG